MAEPACCPTCGGAVRVMGDTTLHYKPVVQQDQFRSTLIRLLRAIRGYGSYTEALRAAGALVPEWEHEEQ